MVDCLTDGILGGFIDGNLDAEVLEHVRVHLIVCTRCARRREELEETRRILEEVLGEGGKGDEAEDRIWPVPG